MLLKKTGCYMMLISFYLTMFLLLLASACGIVSLFSNQYLVIHTRDYGFMGAMVLIILFMLVGRYLGKYICPESMIDTPESTR